MKERKHTIWFDDLTRADVPLVGGKNASLGEMVRNLSGRGVRVPFGFATTAKAYWSFVDANALKAVIESNLADFKTGKMSLPEAGQSIRRAFVRGDWPEDIAAAIRRGYRELSARSGAPDADVAVRSSATAEDLPGASFAGQQESFLNIRGETALLDACRRCFASLSTDRAISYREAKGFDHLRIALSIGVQQMVRADLAGAGVMFSIDTETGFDGVVIINAAWGLGETVVQGAVDPDEYQVFKTLLHGTSVRPIIEKKLGQKISKATGEGPPTRSVPASKAERASFVLSDADILQLARWACAIEAHYGMPMASSRPGRRRCSRVSCRASSSPTGSSPKGGNSPQASASAMPLLPAECVSSTARTRSPAFVTAPSSSRKRPIPTGCRS